MEISEALLTKYNYPVPRYTSYPPANKFSESFTAVDYKMLLEESNNGNPENLSLYIHIPFCRKICHYCGCNAIPAGNGDMIIPYLKALKKEIKIISESIDKTRKVSQIHYGGGTPNSIDAGLIKELNDFIFSGFTFIDDPEIAIECNPAYLDYNYTDQLLSAGFNRFSIGIQDFDEKILKIVNRDPSFTDPGELLNYLKKHNKNISVNFDLIYGLPGQTALSFAESVRKAISIRPDRLVTFSYAHIPWLKKHQVILEKKGLPQAEEKMRMFLSAYNLLSGSGYQPLGLDHFVLPDDDLHIAFKKHELHRNFQGYCTRRTTGQVYAFGVTAISQLEKGYSQNIRDVNKYIRNINEGILPVERGCRLGPEQMLTRQVITELMCNKHLSFPLTASQEGVTTGQLKNAVGFTGEKLKGMIEDGLLSFSDDVIEVTENGSFFIRNITALFDKEFSEKKLTYSRNV